MADLEDNLRQNRENIRRYFIELGTMGQDL